MSPAYAFALASAAVVGLTVDRLMGERCQTRSAAVFVVAAFAVVAAIVGVTAQPAIAEPGEFANGVDVPFFAASTLAAVLASFGVLSPRIGPRPASALMLTVAGFVGGLQPFGPIVLLWWWSDRRAFRRPVWTLAAMLAAAAGLDVFRDDPRVVSSALMLLTLIAAWAGRPHTGQQSSVSAAFAAVLMLRFGWLTGPASLPQLTTAAAVSAVALFALAAGREVREEAGRAGIAWAIASSLVLLAAAAESLGSRVSGGLLLAVCTTLAAASLVESRVSRVGRLSGLGVAGLTGLLPALPLTTGLVWWPVVADLLSQTVASPMTGVPEPSGSAGLIASLIVFGPLPAAGRWLVRAEPRGLVTASARR